MEQALLTMLEMQHRMNTRVHPNWQEQGFAWYRAIWIECAELMDHYGYKWWKKQEPDMSHVELEIIDIWHFGLSALLVKGFARNDSLNDMAQALSAEINSHLATDAGVRDATELLAQHALAEHGFSIAAFWDLLLAANMNFDQLYRAYVGKNVLNFFRQDHGYKEGSYHKQWHGREDNEHLMELMNTLDSSAADFSDQVYQGLKARYPQNG